MVAEYDGTGKINFTVRRFLADTETEPYFAVDKSLFLGRMYADIHGCDGNGDLSFLSGHVCF